MPIILLIIGIIGLYSWFQPAFKPAISLAFSSTESKPLTYPAIFPARPVPTLETSDTPSTSAISVGIYDKNSDLRLWGTNESTALPIASITKLMAAQVFLDTKPDLQSVIEVQASDYREGGKAHFFIGDRVALQDILTTALVASDNTAIAILVRATGLSETEFVEKMNNVAQQWKLDQTIFYDPIGLDSRNKSTVREVARLTKVALTYPEIKEAISLPRVTITTEAGKEVKVISTNLLNNETMAPGIIMLGGKTGSLPAAGYCFVGIFSKNDHEIIAVVLGAETETNRFVEAENLVNWAYRAYTW